MKISELITQLTYLINVKIVNPEDEVILVGSGDKKSGLFLSGVVGEKVEFDDSFVVDSKNGFNGIGFVDQSKIPKIDFGDKY